MKKNMYKVLMFMSLFCSSFTLILAAENQEAHPVQQFFSKLIAPFSKKEEPKIVSKKMVKQEKKRAVQQEVKPLQKKKKAKKKLVQKPKAKKDMIPKMVLSKAPRNSWSSLHQEVQETGYYGCPENESFNKLRADLFNAQPAWPFMARNFLQKDTVEVEFSASFADKAFFDTERTTISPLIFGKKKIQLQDFLLVSRLLRKELINRRPFPKGGSPAIAAPHEDTFMSNVFKVYADQEVSFETSYNSQIFQINYARQWLDGKLTTGMMLPIVRKSHRIINSFPLDGTLSASYDSLGQLPKDDFEREYPERLKSLMQSILYKKNIEINEYNDEVGCGDVTLFLQTHVDLKYCHEAHFGLQLTLPIGKTRDVNKLWSPDLGNGGFAALTGHCALLWHGESSLLNPHVYSQLTYSFLNKVNRRVPVIKTYEGSDPGILSAPSYSIRPTSFPNLHSAQEFMLYGNKVTLDENKKFSESDSVVKELSDKTAYVDIRPGVVWKTRIGNLFKELYFENLSCNLYYDVEVKESDSIGFYTKIDDLNRNILTENTNGQKHAIGVTMQYQFNEGYRLNVGFDHVFAGKNCMQTYQFSLNFSAEF